METAIHNNIHLRLRPYMALSNVARFVTNISPLRGEQGLHNIAKKLIMALEDFHDWWVRQALHLKVGLGTKRITVFVKRSAPHPVGVKCW